MKQMLMDVEKLEAICKAIHGDADENIWAKRISQEVLGFA
jgi:hypothetical protein